jgi:hypothetical protein
VQGGAVYNVSEGVFYKRDLRDSHMAAQFFNVSNNTENGRYRDVSQAPEIFSNTELICSSFLFLLCFSCFLQTLFNLNKFVQSEQRDPIRIKQIHDTPQLSDWDRYAISGSVHGRKAATRGAIAMSSAQGT